MLDYSGVPWPKINDYIMEIATARNPNQMLHLALHKLNEVIPFDHTGILGWFEYPGKVSYQETIGGSETSNRAFQEYYCRLIPDLGWSEMEYGSTDWNEHHHTEYVTDFIRPHNIRYSAGVLKLSKNVNLSISMNRSPDMPRFSESEMKTLGILQGHLSNLSAIFSLACPQTLSPEMEDIRSIYPVLTRREADIAALLCHKYSAEVIGSKLLISTRTVYKHTENIFAKLKVNCRKDLRAKLLGVESVSKN